MSWPIGQASDVGDLFAQLRQRDVFDLAGVLYVLSETKGSITIVPGRRIARQVARVTA